MTQAASERASREAEEAAWRAREEAWEAAERAERLAEEAKQAADERAARSLDEHREITANAWRATAESMCQRAEELLKAGLTDEAGVLCEQGLRNDPGNLHLRVAKSAALFATKKLPEFDSEVAKLSAMVSGRLSGAAPEIIFSGVLSAEALVHATARFKPLVQPMFRGLGKRVHEKEAKDIVRLLFAAGWTDEIVKLVADGTMPPCAVGAAINASGAPSPTPGWIREIVNLWRSQYSIAANVALLPWEDRISLLDFLYYLIQQGTDAEITQVEKTVADSLTLENAESEYLQNFISNAWPLSRYRLTLLKASIFVSRTTVPPPCRDIRDVPRNFPIENNLGRIILISVVFGLVAFILVGVIAEKWIGAIFWIAGIVAAPFSWVLFHNVHRQKRTRRLKEVWQSSVNRLKARIDQGGLKPYVEIYGVTESEDGAPLLRIRNRAKEGIDALLQSRRLATLPDNSARRTEVRDLLERAANALESVSESAATGSSLFWLARTYDPASFSTATDTARAETLYLKAAGAFQHAGTEKWQNSALEAARAIRSG